MDQSTMDVLILFQSRKMNFTNVGEAFDGISQHFIGRALPCAGGGL